LKEITGYMPARQALAGMVREEVNELRKMRRA
jgi:hypothetical protein